VGRILTITNSNENTVGVKKRSIKREIVIGPNAIKFISITIFAILALVYLTQSTAGANRSMKVRDVNDKQAALELQKEQLEVEKYRLQSLTEIEGGIEKPAMQPISQVEHIQDNGLARN